MAKTKKQVKADFQEEIAKPMVDSKELFYKAIKKDPKKLSKEEVRALIYRQSFLSDEERRKFKNILVIENLTKEEESRFHRILPDKAFNKYFPKKENVKEHYKVNFLGGKNGDN